MHLNFRLVVVRLLLVFNCVQSIGAFSVDFEVLSTLYLPYKYTPQPHYGLAKDAAEQMTYDANTHLIYSVGGSHIHVINVTDLRHPTIIYNTSLADTDITDVEVCDGYVFVAVDNTNSEERELGSVNVYRVYNTTTQTLELLHQVTVGVIPDMVHPLSNCKKVLVAIEAEPFYRNGTLVDRPGGIGIITLNDDDSKTPLLKILDFDKFNSRVDELAQSGVRFVYQENNTFANDVEPEYIAVNSDETKAYIILQENNGVAVVDINTETIEDIFGLGYKQWSELTMDPSNTDGGIHMSSWPVYGMYQPDAVKFYRFNGQDYIITANEGDSKELDETTIADIQLADDFDSHGANMSSLQSKEHLGRLKVSKGAGLDAVTGKYERLYAYGARGFSIWRADTMEQVYDSGDEISTKTRLLLPGLFNGNLEEFSVVSDMMDDRSDDKGPESESLTIGQFGDITLLMVGNERPGTIAVYTIDSKLPKLSPTFVTFIHGIPRTNETFKSLYDAREVSMLDPEDIHFIPATDSPNGQPLLMVSGSTSGTISIIQVNVEKADETVPDTSASPRLTSSRLTVLLQQGVTFVCLAWLLLLR